VNLDSLSINSIETIVAGTLYTNTSLPPFSRVFELKWIRKKSSRYRETLFRGDVVARNFHDRDTAMTKFCDADDRVNRMENNNSAMASITCFIS
jgi:hypothetical protein